MWRPSAVIFDMDGVLFDSEAMWYEAFQLLASEGYFKADIDFFRSLIGLRSVDSEERIIEFLDGCMSLEEFKRGMLFHLEEVKRPYNGSYRLKPGVALLLKHLRDSGMRMGVATSTVHSKAISYLEAADLLKFFFHVVGGDQVSQGKPHPEIYEYCAKKLDVAPERVLVFEDSLHGVGAAHAAGMRVVHVPDMLPTCERIAQLVKGSLERIDQAIGIYVD
jgi:beta-phosphoglucomutase